MILYLFDRRGCRDGVLRGIKWACMDSMEFLAKLLIGPSDFFSVQSNDVGSFCVLPEVKTTRNAKLKFR